LNGDGLARLDSGMGVKIRRFPTASTTHGKNTVDFPAGGNFGGDSSIAGQFRSAKSRRARLRP